MSILKRLLLTAAFFSSTLALAVSESNKTIIALGSQGNMAYVSLSPALTTSCPYNILYVADLNTAAGKATYATLLTAYTSGGALGRIDYYPNAAQGNRCDIYIVEVQ